MPSVTYVPSRIGEGFFTDVPIPVSGDNGKALTYNHATGKYIYTAFEASGAVAAHVGLSDPHTQYLLKSGVSAFGATLIDDADAATARSTLGLGTMATATETSYPLLDGSRTMATATAQTFTSGVVTGIIRPASNSTIAFRVQNAAGSGTAFTVDTTNLAVSCNYMTIGGFGYDSRFNLYLDITNTANALKRASNYQLRVDTSSVAITSEQSGFFSKLLFTAGSNTMSDGNAFVGQFQHNAAGTASLAKGVYANITLASTGNITNSYLFYGLASNLGVGGSYTNIYGLYLENMPTATNAYAIYTKSGDIRLMASNSDKIGFHGVAPVARQLLATGAGATVDNVITALQTLGLLRQS